MAWPIQPSREIDDFLADALRHHRSSDGDLKKIQPNLPWVPATYEAVCGLANRTEPHEPYLDRLDRIRDSFDQASPVLWASVRKVRDAEIAQLSAEAAAKDRSVYSVSNFSAVPLRGTFDLIWCGSLITHVSEHDVLAIVGLFERHLRPGGVMIFTTHGREMYRRRVSGRYGYGITDAQFEELAATYQSGRHGFVEYAHRRGYGISLTPPQWIVAAITACDSLSLVSFTEAGWDNHQDVVVVAKR